MDEQFCINAPAVIARALASYFALQGLTQNAVAEASGLHQSQVCRILSGKFKRCSKNVLKLCKFAKINISQARANPQENPKLMEALSFAWDGTEDHAEAIARVLMAIGDLRQAK